MSTAEEQANQAMLKHLATLDPGTLAGVIEYALQLTSYDHAGQMINELGSNADTATDAIFVKQFRDEIEWVHNHSTQFLKDAIHALATPEREEEVEPFHPTRLMLRAHEYFLQTHIVTTRLARTQKDRDDKASWDAYLVGNRAQDVAKRAYRQTCRAILNGDIPQAEAECELASRQLINARLAEVSLSHA